MVSQYLVCLLLSCSSISSVPAPQTADFTITSVVVENSKNVTDQPRSGRTSLEDGLGGLGELLKLGGGLVQGLLALLGEKVSFVTRILGNKELRDQVGNTVAAGVDFTGQIARVAVPVVQAAAQSVPTLIETAKAAIARFSSDANQDRASRIVDRGSQVAERVGTVVSQVPELLGHGSRLLGSVIKAANDTAPLILNGIQEFTEQLPLITGFASAYAEVNAENTQKLAQTFYTSLQCDLQCRDVVDKDLKLECEVKFCTKEEEHEV